MIVIRFFANAVSVKDESSVALVLLVSDAQPVSPRADFPLASEDKTRLENQRTAALTSNKRPESLRLIVLRLMS